MRSYAVAAVVGLGVAGGCDDGARGGNGGSPTTEDVAELHDQIDELRSKVLELQAELAEVAGGPPDTDNPAGPVRGEVLATVDCAAQPASAREPGAPGVRVDLETTPPGLPFVVWRREGAGTWTANLVEDVITVSCAGRHDDITHVVAL
ncbi:MAG TPA: hypothetical protein VD864_13090 [Nocardioides sp.]|nr:hypothetical protein [Nocardioides sp.]